MKPMQRRRFLQCTLGAGVALALSGTMRLPGATAAKGGALTKYLEPVPLRGAAGVERAGVESASTRLSRP
jgi:hypothetical protein